VQNLTLAAAAAEISMGAPKFKMGYVTLTAPLLRVICHPYAGTWYSLPGTKFDHARFRGSRDMVGAQKNLNGSCK